MGRTDIGSGESKGKRENILRVGDGMETMLRDAARLRVRAVLAAVLLAGAGVAMGQIKAPRYQSPIDAPQPQLALPTPPPRSSPDATVVEDVIVRVNDQIIDRSDVERNRETMVEAAQQGKLSPAEFAQAQKDMLRDMIDEQLLLSRGKELEMNVDSEVIRQLDEIRKQNKLDSMEALEKAVRGSGISYEDWKADMKNRIIRQEVVRDEVGRRMNRPTAKEEQAFYDLHKQEFEQPEQVRLSEILIPTPEAASDAQIAQAQAKADEVAAKLKAGEKFEELAKQYGGDQLASSEPFKRGALPKVLEDQTFSLKAGETTAPIRTRQGYVVLKVTEHVAAGVAPLKDVEEQVQEGMYTEQMQPALRKYLTDLREKAYIDIAPGFVDSGASPRETKAVYVASTPLPVAKKKSVAQKQRLESGRGASPAVGAAKAAGGAAGGSSAGGASAAGSSVPAAAGSSAVSSSVPATGAATGKTVNVAAGTKPRKIRREKVRFGQAPRNSLPAGPEEAATPGADRGGGAGAGALAVQGTAAAPAETTNVASNADQPLAPLAAERKKTRYSDRAATEGATKAAEKSFKAKVKVADAPAPLTPEEKVAQQTQDAPLGLGGDTSIKKKPKKVKGAPKERLEDKPPAPAAAKPEMTPIPPKSVRDNGEPVVTPPANPAPGAGPDAPAPAAPAPPQ